jgi:gamma-glutamyltranspeptidase/glutathione hydrolase
VKPLGIEVWGHSVWTVPPNSQGYLTLAGARIAAGLPLPSDPEDPLWAHLTIESSRQAAFDRGDVLHEHADGVALTSDGRLAPRRAAIRTEQAATLGDTYSRGGTIYLCAVDSERCGVSLIQSNANGFGANLAEPTTGIFLHNRGIGFNLIPDHPAEYGPGRRPPHTLSPALVTGPEGGLRLVLGTMGGDGQPQVLLQLLTRLLLHGESVGDAVAAPRWVLESADNSGGFRTWTQGGRVRVTVEPEAPPAWRSGLEQRGHQVRVARANYGHAHVIDCRDRYLEGASDPRSLAGEAAGY